MRGATCRPVVGRSDDRADQSQLTWFLNIGLPGRWFISWTLIGLYRKGLISGSTTRFFVVGHGGWLGK